MNLPAGLIEACIENKRSAQQQLYKCCFGYMMAICLRYERNREDAEFLLNLSFYKVLTKLHTYKPESPLKPWVKRITVNTIIDEYRKKKTKEVSFDENIDYSNQNFWTDQADDNLKAEDLEKLIAQLPETTRKVFNLYAIDGYGHQEIGKMIGLSEGTSKWHLHSARKKLQESLRKMQEPRTNAASL